MKKICIVLSGLFILSSLTSAQNNITIRTKSTPAGDTGTFRIIMKNDLAVNGLNFVIRYDPGVIKPLAIDPTGKATLLGGSGGSGFGGDRISFLVYDNGSNKFAADSGEIFSVRYRVADSVHNPTSTPLAFVEGMVADSSSQPVAFEYFNGAIPIVLGVHDRPQNLPLVFRLEQNYPNPFNPTTTVRYEIPRSSFVTLKVYNILGQEVVTLVREKREPGRYEVQFDGSKFSSGVYFYRLDADGLNGVKRFSREVQKMMLVK